MTQTLQRQTVERRRRAAVPYYSAAIAIRTADAGSAAAIVLLVLSTANSAHPDTAEYAAVLAACSTIPHMLGPLSARVMSLVPSPKAALCGAFALYAVLFFAAGVLIRQGSLLPAAVALVVSGFLGPLFTGGLSSHLGSLVSEKQSVQRRAQSADSLTYAISNSAGNSLVGAIAAAVSPLATVFVLCALAAVAAVSVAFLPLERAASAARQRASIKNVLLAMGRIKPLRDITIITYGNAVGLGSLIVLATTFARSAGLSASVGPILIAVMGLGSLATAVYFIFRPLAFDVMATAKWCAVVSGIFIIVPAVSDVWLTGLAFLVVGGCQSVLNTAAFAVRREASPEELRASVFVTMAGLKIALASLGLALAGLVPVDKVQYGFVLAGLASLVAGVIPQKAKPAAPPRWIPIRQQGRTR
ncbi:hypothetical protein [Kitasatospora sp. GP82]|uniref:hypothetical protein n=1 Tax=Kitasatospora sp. GP82 TaxID=3035089 RepID=UPI0024735AF9|nr:hypothetical protein [Kitasatospora sp. GP82]MDH6123908.1 hypothetical protein [Kitasatospora sp. GP82]